MKLLHRLSMIVGRFASKEATRYNLSGILVTEEETVAANNACMAWMTHPQWDVKNFPQRPSMAGMKGGKFPAMLDADKAERLFRFIGKKQSIPSLAGILTDGNKFVATDLEADLCFDASRDEKRFPDWKKSIPTGKPLVQLCLNPKYLALVAKAVTDFQDYGYIVRLTIYNSETGVRFDAYNTDTGQTMSAILMPCRAEHPEKFPCLPQEKVEK